MPIEQIIFNEEYNNTLLISTPDENKYSFYNTVESIIKSYAGEEGLNIGKGKTSERHQNIKFYDLKEEGKTIGSIIIKELNTIKRLDWGREKHADYQTRAATIEKQRIAVRFKAAPWVDEETNDYVQYLNEQFPEYVRKRGDEK